MKISTVVTGISSIVTLIFSYVHCVIVTKPDDAGAKVGDIVNMRCSSSYINDSCGKIYWKHFKMNSESGDYLYINNNPGHLNPSVTSYISLINFSAGNCDLRINATKSAAGRYQCLDPTPNDASAQLIVLENDPEVEVIKKSHSNNIAMRCSVNYYGNWAPKMQWMKAVGDSRTNVTATESETSKSPVSSLVQIPSAKFDSTGATEYFICNVTIPQYGGSNMPIYNWQSLKNDTTWRKETDFNQISCDDCGNGIYIGLFVFFVISTLICIVVIVFTWRKLTRERQRSQAMAMDAHAGQRCTGIRHLSIGHRVQEERGDGEDGGKE